MAYASFRQHCSHSGYLASVIIQYCSYVGYLASVTIWQRNRYDAEEEFRKLRTRTTTATGGFSEIYRSAERGQGGAGRRTRDRYDSWSGYSHQHQRWQSGPDAAQPDTYARRGRYGSNNSSRSNGDGGRFNDYDWDDM